jgi:D-sedoheptulose 7-phosphate isomerase
VIPKDGWFVVGEPAAAVPVGPALADPAMDWLKPFSARYIERVVNALSALDDLEVHHVVEAINRVRHDGGTVFVAGNGGSAATATHLVNDLAKATRRSGAPLIRAVSLTDSVSWLTALANDEGYDRVFVGQLENLARPGDLLVLISASGNSPNLVRAVEYARASGLETAALLGFDGGVLRSMVDHVLWVPTEPGAYGLVENVHSVLCDLVTACLADPASPYATRRP